MTGFKKGVVGSMAWKTRKISLRTNKFTHFSMSYRSQKKADTRKSFSTCWSIFKTGFLTLISSCSCRLINTSQQYSIVDSKELIRSNSSWEEPKKAYMKYGKLTWRRKCKEKQSYHFTLVISSDTTPRPPWRYLSPPYPPVWQITETK